LNKSNQQEDQLSGYPENLNNTDKLRTDSLNPIYGIIYPGSRIRRISGKILKFALISLLLSVNLKLSAPDVKPLYIFKPPQIEPFNDLVNAIGMVETGNNPLAYNPLEQAAGFLQIRPVRLDDYNMRTGNNYRLEDMFNPELSKKVFLYYASRTGPYNLEKITRDWNGSGPKTEFYWRRVKKLLHDKN